MKHKIINEITKAQERLLGYIGQMSYEYSQLCIKADPSSLLGFEETMDGHAGGHCQAVSLQARA